MNGYVPKVGDQVDTIIDLLKAKVSFSSQGRLINYAFLPDLIITEFMFATMLKHKGDQVIMVNSGQ